MKTPRCLIIITACALSILALTNAQSAKPCDKAKCVLPNCRCFSDNSIPGGLEVDEVPQMVVVSMDYSLNKEYKPLYDQVFAVDNPNACPIRGTFYVQKENSDPEIVQGYADSKFEIGVNSLNGAIPEDGPKWIQMIKDVKEFLVGSGVKADEVVGLRSPQLTPGGNDMFTGMGNNGLLYDASCVSRDFSAQTSLKWPFTLDYDFDVFECNSGKATDIEFPGKWQVLIGELDWKKSVCATPQSCPDVNTQKDAFDILYNNFLKHYDGDRSPYVVIIDPVWMRTDYKRAGLVQFVEYLRAAFSDVWVVTQRQALQWIQDPTPIANLSDFAPWKCQ